ncbi:MAG: hypothetical protein U5K69_10515 [Balneolaceae bacterium]|nr:hypothetical protein [Balneolaceae bacterium]
MFSGDEREVMIRTCLEDKEWARNVRWITGLLVDFAQRKAPDPDPRGTTISDFEYKIRMAHATAAWPRMWILSS